MSKFFTRSIAAAGFAAALASSASAGFTGWTAAMTNHGSYLYVDVFAGVSVASQHLLNVFNMDIAATGATFVQGNTPATRTWAPAFGTATMDSADSFVTLGMLVDGGQNYASGATSRDPNFTNYLTSGATTIPHLAGWYNTDPLGTDGDAVDLLAAVPNARWDGAVPTYGVWVAHFVFNSADIVPGATLSFAGTAGYRDAGSQVALYGQDTRSFALPAPGAIVVLALGGFASRRRQR